MNKHYGFLLIFCAVWIVSGVFFVARAAPPDVRPGCDPEYMDALEAKAWLLAERRMSQNQNLIFKPDSVLEYSCFDQYMNFLATGPGRRFSESSYWGPISGISATSLDTALSNIVTQPLQNYLASNFNHTFLGGRLSPAPPNPLVPGQYNCKMMSFVWKAARCMNFIDEGAEGRGALDGFYDFPWYASNDPRKMPPNLPSCAPDTRISAAITEAYRGKGKDGIHGNEWKAFVLQIDNDPKPAIKETPFVPYKEDPMLIGEILDKVLPGDCADSALIPTGVYIKIPDQSDFEEYVCSMPSCSYNGTACAQ